MEESSAEQLLSADAPRLVWIEPQQLPRVWPFIEPVLQKACSESRGEFSIQRIVANLENWPLLAIVREEGVQAVMVTCVTQMPDNTRVLDCLLAAGEAAKDWPLVDEEFDAFAKQFGCSRVRIPCARKGWLKTLPHWRIRGYVLEREI